MKRLLLMLAAALPGLAAADMTISLNGSTVSTAPMGCRGTLSSTPTYALNAASPTVSSVAIDLSSSADVFVSVTGAANIPGGPVVAALFAPTSTGVFQVGYKLVGAGNACVPRLNRYMKLVNASMPGVSWTARALTVTASYTLSDIETATATISGAVTVNGMASLSTSAAAGATQATLAVVAGHVTSTALGTAASPTNVTITGNVTVGGFVQLTSAAYAVVNNVVTTINLTSTAAYNGGKPVVAVLSGNGAFRWAQANSSTAPYYLTGTAGHYQAGSTTAIAVIEQATGGANSPHLFVVGAGSNCDVWVGIQRKE